MGAPLFSYMQKAGLLVMQFNQGMTHFSMNYMYDVCCVLYGCVSILPGYLRLI